MAKTPVREIHLYDSDVFLQHNAFRARRSSSEELAEKLPKVVYLQRIYSEIRQGIIARAEHASADSIALLATVDLLFLCMEGREVEIVHGLELHGVPFIDVGIGVYAAGDSLGGWLEYTTSTPALREHVWKSKRIRFRKSRRITVSRNIQIADLAMPSMPHWP